MTEIQKKILEISVDFKRVCEEHNLRYYLFYGTFLGAVRHKGFIPWDDDVDFVMPRPDYEKFLKIAKDCLNKKFALRCLNEQEYIYHFAKIDDTTTTLIEDYNKDKNYKGGIYIDIFPLDGLPSKRRKKRAHYNRSKYFYRRKNLAVVDFTNKKYSWYKRVLIKLFGGSDGRKYLLKLDDKLKSVNYENATLVMSDFEVFDKALFDEVDYYTFEGEKFAGVKDFDKCLKTSYGDYMTLPPEDKRVSNHFAKIDLNKPYGI